MKRKSLYESETESVEAKIRQIIFRGSSKDRKVVCNALNRIFTKRLQSCLAGSSDFTEVWDELRIDYQLTVHRDCFDCKNFDYQEKVTSRNFKFAASDESTFPANEFLKALNRGASKAFPKTAVVRYVPIGDVFSNTLAHDAMVSVFVLTNGEFKHTGFITVPDFAKIVEATFYSVVSHIGNLEQLEMDVDVIAKLIKQYTVISSYNVDALDHFLEDPSIQNQCLSALEKHNAVETSKMYTDWEDAWSNGSYYVTLFDKACAKLKLTCEVEDSMDFYSVKTNKYYGSLGWELVCEFMDGLVEELKSKKIKVPEFVESVIGFIQSESYYDEARFGSEDDWEDDEELED